MGTVAGTLRVDADVVNQTLLTLSGTLIVNRRFELPGLTAERGALITHDAEVETMHLVVRGTFTLPGGAAVDVSGKGLPPGVSISPLTGQRVAGSDEDNAGSHGGLGGLASPTRPLAPVYDDPLAPRFAGGGGGAGWSGTNGGGVGRISAGLMVLEGAVLADGWSKGYSSGAGGSIIVSTGDLSGAGTVAARGGQVDLGEQRAGGGGA